MPEAELPALAARFESFGHAAADALVARLGHSDPKVASSAGLQLAQFATLHPRHLPALIHWDERGNVWITRAIAAVGTEAAFAYLQQRARTSPDFSDEGQLHMALARFGDRLRPFAIAELEACRLGGSMQRCHGMLRTLDWYPGGYPGWAVEPVAALARAPAVPHSVQSVASRFVIRSRHPVGLEILRDELETKYGNPSWDRVQAREAARSLARYGAAAAHLVPLIAAHLESEFPEVQAEAALALGRIGAKGEAAQLIALEPRFEDDWLLAYNVVEGLGRMRAAQARPLLGRTARRHWHGAVRNNSWRALNSLRGGAFDRPNHVGEASPDVTSKGHDGEEYFRPGMSRYANDRSPGACPQIFWGATEAVVQDPPGPIRWPRRGSEALVFAPLPAPAAAALRSRLDGARGSAVIPFRIPRRSGLLTGFEQGEWGGAVVNLRSDGSSETLFKGNPTGALRMGGRLYILEGLSHGVSSQGSVAVIAGDPPRLVRRIRLPAKPEKVLATDRRILVIRTGAGDITIRRDGRLIDPESPAACTKGQR